MKYKIVDLPITKGFRRTNDNVYRRAEHKIRVDGPSAFHILVSRVNVSSPASLSRTPEVVRLSESRYAIPNSTNIKLRTTGYYRDWEESDRCGIGDSEEATLRRNTDFATFQRDAGQTPLPGAHHVQINSTYIRECWILCTSIAPTSLAIKNNMQANVCRGYDATTLIADPSQFAMQLGVDFGNALRANDVTGPGQALWMLRPQIFVDHGPVVYTESPSNVIERFPKASWGLVMPFAKRPRFSDQHEYRFVIYIGEPGEPKERTLDLIITEELRALTRLVEYTDDLVNDRRPVSPCA